MPMELTNARVNELLSKEAKLAKLEAKMKKAEQAFRDGIVSQAEFDTWDREKMVDFIHRLYDIAEDMLR